MKLIRFFRGGNVSASMRLVTLLVIILGAIVTASLSIILEDLLPKGHPEEMIVPPRWVFLISAVLLVAFAVWLRYEVRTYSGTLFSVQALDEGIADRTNEGGTETKHAANSRYMYLRSLHRWADFDHSVEHGVIQLHELSHEIGSTLELLMNTASDDEGTQTIAPNIPWPMALSVGTYLPARQVEIRLLELPTRAGGQQREFPLRYVDEVRTDPDIRKLHHLADVRGDRVGVLLTLAAEADETELENFRRFGTPTVYTVAIPPGENRTRYETSELESLGRIMAEELTAVRADHPDAELIVAATIPAAVGLSIGWHLTQYACPFYRNTHLLYFDGARHIPMRVRPSQPATFSVPGGRARDPADRARGLAEEQSGIRAKRQ